MRGTAGWGEGVKGEGGWKEEKGGGPGMRTGGEGGVEGKTKEEGWGFQSCAHRPPLLDVQRQARAVLRRPTRAGKMTCHSRDCKSRLAARMRTM